MITIEDLKKAQAECEAVIAPFSEEFEIVKAKFSELCDIHEKPYLDMLEDFYDENLQDSNNKPIKVNDVISNGKHEFRVVNRGTQFIFGEILNTPRVMVVHRKKVGKEKHIFPSDLKKYTIVTP